MLDIPDPRPTTGVLAMLWRLVRDYGMEHKLAYFAGAAMLARMAKLLLYGVTPTDPAAFGFALALLITVACVSALIPAYRAARLDPAATLRSE